ncbi:2120_t:CDS:2, partial [Acaulospora colombiana]
LFCNGRLPYVHVASDDPVACKTHNKRTAEKTETSDFLGLEVDNRSVMMILRVQSRWSKGIASYGWQTALPTERSRKSHKIAEMTKVREMVEEKALILCTEYCSYFWAIWTVKWAGRMGVTDGSINVPRPSSPRTVRVVAVIDWTPKTCLLSTTIPSPLLPSPSRQSPRPRALAESHSSLFLLHNTLVYILPPLLLTMATDYDPFDAILHHIFKQTQGQAWFKPTEESMQVSTSSRLDSEAGVALRIENNPPRFRVFPYENMSLVPFEAAVRGLNPLVAVKTRSAAVHAALGLIGPTDTGFYIDTETRIQVVDCMEQLPAAEKDQCAAFVRDERVLVCWADSLDSIIPNCNELDDKLMALVWKARQATVASQAALHLLPVNPKASPFPKNQKLKPPMLPMKSDETLFAPVYNGIGAALALAMTLDVVRKLLYEFWLDGLTLRFALVAVIPFLFCGSLCIGPVAQFHQNSKYYSAVKPAANPVVDKKLPHITIQMPVYKESLKETIAPSCESIKKAMQTYARQGGTSSIMICDDGMQLIDEEQASARKRYYMDHNIGWISRPAHSSDPDGFKRAGRFKKASNMNYALNISLKMEQHLEHYMQNEQAALNARTAAHLTRATEREQGIMGGWEEQEDMEPLEDLALRAAMDEVFAESGHRFQPQGAGGRAVRMGEIILIVDSDTIVPEDCLRDAAREMAESPEVGVIQHESDVMQVSHNYFENGIAHFTRRINKAISFAAANGEVAAFVGHNAFLRWSALQDVAFVDPEDGITKIWSESNVSEDFDMALRLQLGGYIVRWATYSEGGFKEGVSLTADDELNRWEKYSYGCSELIFNPLIKWFTRGPVTGQLHKFVWSNAPFHYKLSMLAYMFSYYGIAASFTLSVMNYFVIGWRAPIDGMYLQSWEIWVAIVFIFPLCGNLAHTLLEYRLGQKGLIAAFFENIMWIPFL